MTEKRELRAKALALAIELAKIHPPAMALGENDPKRTTLWDIVQMQSEAIEEYILSVR